MRCNGAFSPLRFERGSCGIAAISSDSWSNEAGFLCNPDCVAERGDSNPRYRSEGPKCRRVRKLHGIDLLSGDKGPGGVRTLWQTSAVSSLFKRRMAGDSTSEIALYRALQAKKFG